MEQIIGRVQNWNEQQPEFGMQNTWAVGCSSIFLLLKIKN